MTVSPALIGRNSMPAAVSFVNGKLAGNRQRYKSGAASRHIPSSCSASHGKCGSFRASESQSPLMNRSPRNVRQADGSAYLSCTRNPLAAGPEFDLGSSHSTHLVRPMQQPVDDLPFSSHRRWAGLLVQVRSTCDLSYHVVPLGEKGIPVVQR